MAKQPSKIRWRDSDTAELQRVINNFNAKLYRLNKNHPEIVDYLPDRVKKSEIIKSIETRADFNRVIKSLQRFSKRGAETPVKTKRSAKITQWQVDEYKRKQTEAKKKLTRERNRLGEKDLLSRGKKVGTKRIQQGEVWEQRFKPPKRDVMNMSQKEFEKADKAIIKELTGFYNSERMENYKINYMIALENHGFTDDLINYVASIPNDIFYETTVLDQEGDFDFVYTEEDHAAATEALWNVWRKAKEKEFYKYTAFLN